MGHSKRAPLVIFIVNLTMYCFEEKLVRGRLKKMKMGDAGTRVPVVFPDVCYMPPLPGAAMRTMRTVVQFLSSVSCVAQLTHCSAPINIAAALSCLLTSVVKFILEENTRTASLNLYFIDTIAEEGKHQHDSVLGLGITAHVITEVLS